MIRTGTRAPWLRRHGVAALLVLLILAGLALRIAWVHGRHDRLYLSEAYRIAHAFAETGIIADAFRRGQGPTAHLSPVAPAVAGLVVRAFGRETATTNAVLTGGAMALAFGTFLLLFRCFGMLGSSRVARLLAFASLCLLPLNFYLETIQFRYWEGGLAAFLAATMLYAVLRIEAQSRIGLREIVGLSLLAAALFFVNPPCGVAGYLCALLLMIRRLERPRWPRAVLVAAAALTTVLTPWALRNEATFGRPIALRDDFGLELAIANHAGAVAPDDAKQAFWARMNVVQPNNSDAAYRAMLSIGEAAYADRLGRETRAWISAHPGDFLRLSARHAGEILLPPRWHWTMFRDVTPGMPIKVAGTWAISLLGLCGIAAALARADRRWRYPVIMALVPMLPYIVLQPTLRYRYLMLSFLTFFAADLAVRAVRPFLARAPLPTAAGFAEASA